MFARLAALLVLLSACAPTLPPDTVARLIPPQGSALDRAIWAKPELARLRWQYIAALERMDQIDAATRAQITGNVEAGVSADTSGSRDEAARVNLSLAQTLHDAGRSDAQRAEAQLALRVAQVTYALTADQIFADIARAQIERDGAARTVAIIDRYLARYREREAQIKAATLAGVLTNSDQLGIRTSLNQIEATRTRATSAGAAARSRLSMLLGGVDAPRKRPGTPPDWRAQGAKLAIAQSDARLRSVLLATAPRATVQAGLTAPKSDGVGVTLGLRYEFTIYDGGRSASEARAVRAEGQARAADLDTLRDRIRSAASERDQTLRANAAQRRLLRRRVALASERIDEMEKLLRAGRSDIASLSREILLQAETELTLATLDAQDEAAKLAYLTTRGGVCALYRACDALVLKAAAE